MVCMSYIRAVGRHLLFAGMAMMILAPQGHTVCFRDCAETGPAAPSCACHNDLPDCCAMEAKEPVAPAGCGCEDCIEVQLPDRYCSIAKLLEIKRYNEIQIPEYQLDSFLLVDQSFNAKSISPLAVQNHFTSQVDDQISTAVIIS